MDIKNTITVGFDLDKGLAFVQEWETEYILGIGFSQLKETKYFRTVQDARNYVAKMKANED